MLASVRRIIGTYIASNAVLTIIVMPCLNEIDQIEGAIDSILHRQVGASDETHLVVVDNGSTDGTILLLQRLREHDPLRLHIRSEAIRGYVPPRHHGVCAAAEIAAAAGIAAEDTLILQADADTEYRTGYVAAMVNAVRDRQGVMLEGATRRPLSFEIEHRAYVEAERYVDANIEHLEVPDELDVVVDDKVCGYRLSDYFRWGGLFEETTSKGEPIHAETTRLFIRARLLFGAEKIRVNPAGASPSRRRFLAEPRLQFATLGFPREKSWAAKHPALMQPVNLDAFARAVIDGQEKKAVRLRAAHLIALFRYLPAMVMQAAELELPFQGETDVIVALNVAPRRSRKDLAKHPGLALTDALRLVEDRPDLFPCYDLV